MRRIKVTMPFPVPAQERYVPYDMMLNDLGFWYPILLRTCVNVPPTIIVNFGQQSYESTARRIKYAMEEIGYPCFFRGCSIAGSLKHYWKDTCFIETPLTEEQIIERMKRVVKYCGDSNQGAQPLIYENWAIRKYIECDNISTYRDMPLKKEIRVFIKDNKVLCMHPYWSEQMPKGNISYPSDELDKLHEDAEKVAEYFYGYWSCDFLLSKSGEWYAIDMALGEDSFHYKPCRNQGDINC